MSLRRLLNVVYAHLTAGADPEAREKFDRDLYAPLAGWDAVQRRIVELVQEG